MREPRRRVVEVVDAAAVAAAMTAAAPAPVSPPPAGVNTAGWLTPWDAGKKDDDSGTRD
jgi:hypothetical protein